MSNLNRDIEELLAYQAREQKDYAETLKLFDAEYKDPIAGSAPASGLSPDQEQNNQYKAQAMARYRTCMTELDARLKEPGLSSDSREKSNQAKIALIEAYNRLHCADFSKANFDEHQEKIREFKPLEEAVLEAKAKLDTAHAEKLQAERDLEDAKKKAEEAKKAFAKAKDELSQETVMDFERQIQEAEDEVEASELVRMPDLDVIAAEKAFSMREERGDALKAGDLNAAEEACRTRNLNIDYYQSEIQELQAQKAEWDEEISRLEAENKELEALADSANLDIQQLENRNKLTEDIKKDLTSDHIKIQDNKKKLSELNNKKTEYEAKLPDLQRNLEHQQKVLETEETVLAKFQAEKDLKDRENGLKDKEALFELADQNLKNKEGNQRYTELKPDLSPVAMGMSAKELKALKDSMAKDDRDFKEMRDIMHALDREDLYKRQKLLLEELNSGNFPNDQWPADELGERAAYIENLESTVREENPIYGKILASVGTKGVSKTERGLQRKRPNKTEQFAINEDGTVSVTFSLKEGSTLTAKDIARSLLKRARAIGEAPYVSTENPDILAEMKKLRDKEPQFRHIGVGGTKNEAETNAKNLSEVSKAANAPLSLDQMDALRHSRNRSINPI